jgi:hypothetical protein
LNFLWDAAESGLIPTTTVFKAAKLEILSENSRASVVQPLVLSLE